MKVISLYSNSKKTKKKKVKYKQTSLLFSFATKHSCGILPVLFELLG